MSPASGRLSSFNISLGQNLTSGESIGKIDLMGGYKLVAKVDEYYINKLTNGIKGTLDNNGKEYEIVSHSYYILLKGYFISLNFIEQVGKEENSKLFDEIFQSIQISK